MNLGEKDIVIRKFHNDTTLWVSEKYLCYILGNNIANYLRMSGRKLYKKSVPPCNRSKDILPSTGKSWRFARINGQFYYDYAYLITF